MNISKTKLSWIIGLIIAILSAITTYFNTSCSTIKKTTIEVDSTYIGKMKITKDFDGKIEK